FAGSCFLPRHVEIMAAADTSVPLQLPGPKDIWGADMPDSIRVSVSGVSEARVRLSLMESHDAAPPRLSVTAGTCRLEDIQVKPGGGLPEANWETLGTESEYLVRVPAGCASAEGGELVFRPISGSWIAIKSVWVEQIPLPWELWRHLPQPWNYILFWLGALTLVAYHALAAKSGGLGARQLAMYGAMCGIVLLSFGCALVATAFYVEVYYPWLTNQEGNLRSMKVFQKKAIHDEKLGWLLQPGFAAYTRETPKSKPTLFYANTQEGYRALEAEKNFPARGKAMVLGDSFAQGLFLAQKETIPAVMADQLGGYVYNMGITGFSTDQEYTTFMHWIDRVDVERVVLLFYGNDIMYTGSKKGYDLPKPVYKEVNGKVDFSRMSTVPAEYVKEMNDILAPRFIPSMTYCCFTDKKASVLIRTLERTWRYISLLHYPGRFFAALVGDIKNTKLTSPAIHTDVRPELLEKPEKYNRQIDIIFQFLAEINDQCRKRDLKFQVVFVPDILQVYHADKPARTNLRDMFMELCAKNRLACLDPSDRLAAGAKINDVYFIDDGHFSPYGARIVGEMIAKATGGEQ
ncbi:MAG: SGNH/GDSL hydrolase family protein, partial [Nitrospinota bacterium]|nr:SGNH/GDSL hydrolase family protein [Nitrospinota bacterium]